MADRTSETPSHESRHPKTLGIDPALLEILVCPASHAPLRLDVAASELVCDVSGLAYPVRDGIPVLLVDEARPLAPR